MKTNAPLLAVAVVIAGAIAALARPEATVPTAAGQPASVPGAAWSMRQEPDATQGSSLHGQVLEAIDVAEYTYLRLSTASGELWAAVSKAAVEVGKTVDVLDAARMEDFQSATLKRTFPVIYFGHLGDGREQALPPGHPQISAQDAAPSGHPTGQAARTPSVPDARVEPAVGKDAHVIADLYGSRARLTGKPVRVRGQVVKVTAGVLGKNYLRIRDGSSTSPEERELVVTTLASVQVGDLVTLTGTLQTDVDVGIGFKYPVLLADAEVAANL